MAFQEFTTEELKAEEWRDVIEYEGAYQVSNLGRVRRLSRDILRQSAPFRLVQPCPAKRGYLVVTLSSRFRKPKNAQIHRLVAAAFIGPCPIGKQVNHIDRTPPNNRADNLEYLTPKENSQHSAADLWRGEKNHQSKLTADLVRQIRTRTEPQRALAKMFGVGQATIWCIRKRKTWAHIL